MFILCTSIELYWKQKLLSKMILGRSLCRKTENIALWKVKKFEVLIACNISSLQSHVLRPFTNQLLFVGRNEF